MTRGDLLSAAELDLWLLGEGRHERLWTVLGAHPVDSGKQGKRGKKSERGVRFAVWAPNAQSVSVILDLDDWDEGAHPMTVAGTSGVWQAFVPGAAVGGRYKYRIVGPDGTARYKADPVGFAHEVPPGHASVIVGSSAYKWTDDDWMTRRAEGDPRRKPLAAYELHLGSWARMPAAGDAPGDAAPRAPGYREAAPLLVEHCRRFGFTHVELMPIMEHPFGGSWGYQVTGYFAPTQRHGSPDDLRFLIDTLHAAGLGVLLDWVPGHFPGDDFGLARFDGSALYEHEDPRQGKHPHWDTLIFNFGRHEVRNFLLANALFWLEEFHIDGLRVDAVASMLYLDYGREDAEWIPNAEGGRENTEAIDFLRELNTTVRERVPGALMIAEESTAWPGVTHAIEDGGLGFHLKWNMGWMNDTLEFFRTDPIHRGHHMGQITFPMMYEHTEAFLMPLSHDEVVHGKGPLFDKVPGDTWQKLANLRLLLAYQYTRPGKKLLFMGTEIAQDREWDHDTCLDWHLAEEPGRAAFGRFVSELGRLYRDTPVLWVGDPDPDGFRWIACDDTVNQVVAYERHGDGTHLVVALNLTPVPRTAYRIGASAAPGTTYRLLLDSDATDFGGSDTSAHPMVISDDEPRHDRPSSILLDLPPLSALVYAPDRG